MHHLLAIFSKVHEFPQNKVFRTRSACFAIFALGVHFLHFSAKRTSLYKAVFSARDQNVLSFSHLAHYFLAIFSKVYEFVQNNVFCPTSARFVSFALATLLFSDFQQSSRVCAKQHFQPEIRMFCHFRTGCTTFERLLAKCSSLCETAFSARDQHVLSFSYWGTTF